jgi:hypothetical protein
MAANDFSNWDFANYHVQGEMQAGQFVSAETSLIAAGTPSIDGTSASNPTPQQNGAGVVYPIGLLENAGLSQSKQLQKIFEIGSGRSYFIPGRVIGSVSLGRTFYYGPSLMRVMYAYYTSTSTNVKIGTTEVGNTIDLTDGTVAADPLARLLAQGGDAMHRVKTSPGEDYFFVNLASDLFNQATGLAFYFKDANYNSVGAFYLEHVYIQGHQFSISSGSVLIMEGVSAQYDRIVPIKLINEAAPAAAEGA